MFHISSLIHSFNTAVHAFGCHVTCLTSPPGGTRYITLVFKIYREILDKMLELEMNSVEFLVCRVQLTGVDGVGG